MPTSGARLGPTLQCCEEAGFVIWVLWCTTLGLDMVSMPPFKRKPFPQVQPPQDSNPDDPVFQVRFTKEIFRDYQWPILAWSMRRHLPHKMILVIRNNEHYNQRSAFNGGNIIAFMTKRILPSPPQETVVIEYRLLKLSLSLPLAHADHGIYLIPCYHLFLLMILLNATWGVADVLYRDNLCFLAEYLQQVVHGAIPSTYFESETAVPDAEMSVHILNHLYKQLDEVCPVRGGEEEAYHMLLVLFVGNSQKMHSLMGCAPSMASG